MALHQAAPLVTAHAVSAQREGRLILDGISLSVNAGEIVTLIGPNGAGKTSLLRVLLKLVAPTSGTVTHAEGLRIGYLPQRLTPDPMIPLSVDAFLDLWPGRENKAGVLAQTGASALAGRPLAELSGGELQRVLLARALLNKPNLLVLDEPVQALDIHGQAALYDLVATLRDTTHCAILMVSHDLHVVMGKTDRVFCINRHVCCHGTPESIRNDPAYHALFGQGTDSFALSFALYHHHHDHTHDGAVACSSSHPAPSSRPLPETRSPETRSPETRSPEIHSP